MKIKLTKNDAQEVIHKIGVLADSEDLQADYNLTKSQADALFDSIPHCGGEWEVPAWGEKAVREEMKDHVKVMREGCAAGAFDAGKIGQSLSINKQAKRLEGLFA